MPRLTAIGLFLCLAITGCGDSDELQRTEVTGKVTFDGEPVNEGTMTLIPAAGNQGSGSGTAIVDGEYTIEREKGPTPGTYQVQIVGRRKTGKEIPAGPPAPPGSMVPEIESYIPAKYNTATTLTINIDSVAVEKDFNLTSADGPAN